MDHSSASTMGASMSMTFSPLPSYQTKVLWDWWDVRTKTQFAFSLLFVALACVFYHYVRLAIVNLEEGIRDEIRSAAAAAGSGSDGYGIVLNGMYGIVLNGMHSESNGITESLTADKTNRASGTGRARNDSGSTDIAKPSTMFAIFMSMCLPRGGRGAAKAVVPKRLQSMLLLHAFLSAFAYALALLLMLVAMTYNSLLFLSLVAGYFAGDYLFYIAIATKSARFAAADEYSCH